MLIIDKPFESHLSKNDQKSLSQKSHVTSEVRLLVTLLKCFFLISYSANSVKISGLCLFQPPALLKGVTKTLLSVPLEINSQAGHIL